jgi:hypothetical protein
VDKKFFIIIITDYSQKSAVFEGDWGEGGWGSQFTGMPIEHFVV